MSDWKPKRFWSTVDVLEQDAGYSIALDGRGVKTPAKAALILPTRALAEEIAAEWAAQEDVVNPLSMPFTRTANAAIDKVQVQHAEVADMLAAYGDSDLLCYRASGPEELVQRQSAQWDPLLDWAEETLGARLFPRAGVMHSAQEAEALKALTKRTHALNAFELAAFHDLVSLSGSLVIGFAATHNAEPIQTLWRKSRLDEIWQEEQWGVDEEAHETAQKKQTSFLHAKRFFDSVQDA